jgi:hypothetical protein
VTLHRLNKTTIGVPDVDAPGKHYNDFGFSLAEHETVLKSTCFRTVDAGEQLHLVDFTHRRLIELRIGSDDPDVDRVAAALSQLDIAAAQGRQQYPCAAIGRRYVGGGRVRRTDHPEPNIYACLHRAGPPRPAGRTPEPRDRTHRAGACAQARARGAWARRTTRTLNGSSARCSKSGSATRCLSWRGSCVARPTTTTCWYSRLRGRR